MVRWSFDMLEWRRKKTFTPEIRANAAERFKRGYAFEFFGNESKSNDAGSVKFSGADLTGPAKPDRLR